MPHALGRDVILAARDMVTERVAVPEWGGEVILSSFTGAARDDFEAEMFEGKGTDRRANYRNLRARLVARTLVDDAGNRLFEDADIAAVGMKNAAVLDRLFAVAQRLNALGERDVVELTENFPGDPCDVSPSSSPVSSAV